MLTDKQRKKIIDKLATEDSDSKIADKAGVSRSTVWRIRQEELEKQAKLKRARARMKSKEINKMKAATPVVPAPAVVSTPPAPPQIVTAPVDPMPKVDAEPVVMATYFAAQLLRGESVRDVANVIMQRAELQGRLFRKLQVMDCISVGTSVFVRFRSDLTDVSTILEASNRGFISFSDGAFRVTFLDGRRGIKYPATVMLSVQKAGFGQVFAGPKIKRWAQQFASAN